MPEVTVISEQGQRAYTIDPGQTLHDLLRREGVALDAPCGGRGSCGKCRVRLLSGETPIGMREKTLLTPEQLNKGIRLACLMVIEQDVTVALSRESGTILTDGLATQVTVDPPVRQRLVTLPPPSLEDQRSDLSRLIDGMGEALSIPLPMLAMLPETLRRSGFAVYCLSAFGRLLDIYPTQRRLYAAALDIGTTTLAMYLMDLESGEQRQVTSRMNPQRVFGADVISRIEHTMTAPGGPAALQSALVGGNNEMIRQLAQQEGIAPDQIVLLTAVGNTVMLHLFAGIPANNIAAAPFIPAFTHALQSTAQDLGISVHPNAALLLGPCVAGYVGADTVAAALACGMDRTQELSLLVDIGTNGEIVLGNRDGITCCSTAAGPAFEGAHIRHGCGGVPGAVSHIALKDGTLRVDTIADAPPVGICGSGLVDAVALLLERHAIDETGAFTPEDADPALKEYFAQDADGRTEFRLTGSATGDIVLSQRDLREVQLAKAAIAAGIEVLVQEMQVDMEQISTVYLAGGFGNYIDFNSACHIGLLPPSLRGKIRAVGNAAGVGAKLMALSQEHIRHAEELACRMRYVELSTRADFQDWFVERMMFG